MGVGYAWWFSITFYSNIKNIKEPENKIAPNWHAELYNTILISLDFGQTNQIALDIYLNFYYFDRESRI